MTAQPETAAATARPRARTQVICGLDEAGLGPLLGPLAIGYAALAVPREEPDPWRLLKKVVGRKEGKRKRLVVADSKKVFTRNPKGWKRLERTALTFLSVLRPDGRPPRDARELLFGELAPPAELVDRHPWYAALPALPVVHEAGTIELAAAGLARELAARGVELLAAGVRLVPAGELNASFARTGNKGETVWRRVRQVLRLFWERHGESDPEVTVDVLGGRMRYGSLLAGAFEEATVEVVREEPEHSAYVVCERDDPDGRRWLPRRMRIAFRVRGEEASFPVALGSCLAKYAREVSMEAFNAWFERHQQGLHPTAGYRGDAQRWLADAQPALRAAGLPQELLIRQR